jgi:formylglycine-generating enzyme required for sulfatase activity
VTGQNAGLVLRLYPGLTITGQVGTVYSIQYATNANQTSGWRCLDFLRLPSSNYFWVDPNPPTASRRFYRAVVDAHAEMVFIPPGTFRMGSPPDEVGRSKDEGPQTVVTITRGFWIGTYKVNQREYQFVTSSNPSIFNQDPELPVETVDWADAMNYCARLTERQRASRDLSTNSFYRLPTEAEWEYACRALTSTRYSYGDDPGYTNLMNYAWYGENSDRITHRGGQKLPNPWGLYDMHGGLWEWCMDWYGPYAGGSAVDPAGPSKGEFRVFRGGSWGCEPEECRSAQRDFNPEGETAYVGFRVVLVPGSP